MKKTITLNIQANEKDLVESCLNLKHSGYEYMFMFSLFALAKSWHLDKFSYYYKLIEGESSTGNKETEVVKC